MDNDDYESDIEWIIEEFQVKVEELLQETDPVERAHIIILLEEGIQAVLESL